MIHIDRNDVYKFLITALLSLLAYIGNGIHNQQIDIACKVRMLELNQVRIMERLGVEPIAQGVGSLHQASQNPLP